MKLKIDDRVILKIWYSKARPANPKAGTEFACEGTVVEIKDRGITVDWDNGQRNYYYSHSLEIVNSSYKSIW